MEIRPLSFLGRATAQGSRQHDGAKKRSFPPQCGQHAVRTTGTSSPACCWTPTAKPYANAIRPFTSSIFIEKLGDRKP